MVEAQVTAPLVRTARHPQHSHQEEDEEEDTEYAFPRSTNASAFSPDPHHALVETGATQQGFIVCVKGSFGFICLLSGQSPDDLFFHISALEQVRGVKREVPKRKHWGEGVLSHCALCVWHRGDVDRGGEGLSRVGGHESFLQAVALHLLCGNVV
jgi:hypothetical protein